jgi:hypothetical protein
MVKVFFAFLLFASVIFPQEFRVKAFTDTSEYMIGDHIKLHFVVEHEKGFSYEEPSFRDSIQNIDVISVGKAVKKEVDGKIETSYDIVLSRYDSSDIIINPITFYYWYGPQNERAPFLYDRKTEGDTLLKSSRSNEVSFRVNAVKVNIEEDIKDVKEPLTIPPDWKIIALYIIVAVIIILIAYYLYRKYRKKKGDLPEKAKIVIPPHVIALTSLGELEKKQLWQHGLIKEFHSEVTGVIRRYFEDRFELPALELTTGETVELLARKDSAKEIIGDTNEFLNNADLVKFAKFVPLNDINEMMLKKAYDIVEKTIPAGNGTAEVENVQ